MTHKRKTIINWSIITLIFILFLTWHGAFDRPLNQAEVDELMTKYHAADLGTDTNKEDLREFLESGDGKPVYMINVIKNYDQPKLTDAMIEKGMTTDMTAEEVLADYTGFVFPYLIKNGSYPIYTGTALLDSQEVWGIENATEWSSGAIIRYKDRRTMIEMATDPAFAQFHDSKIAAIEKTVSYPLTTQMYFVDLSYFMFVLLALIGSLVQFFINRRSKHEKITD
ncbi:MULTISPECIES: hypothetical protein [unclassified Fusibacter]|uniref:hypothetical protein n=1 Tax=unclassified Fusibacter TaxID=2624464 RepID=UPI001012B7E9|nr:MULTISPECIES: hypothetical protein [unclassified Fusibacter]MCK8059906.1 hypothetical protein [Fusibacter sp. A2]NPE22048.1 hypothetical protein [Fusibacter sp. A1]RXV60829.1 hypothetical protein DWB64_09400 [Fusibacter sp. A1]